MHDECIPRQRSFDIKRPRLRISSRGADNRVMIGSSGIDAPGMNGVARIDFQDRVDCPGEEAMKLFGLESMKAGGVGWTGRRPLRGPGDSLAVEGTGSGESAVFDCPFQSSEGLLVRRQHLKVEPG